MRQTMHNMSVEKIIKRPSLTELTQEKMVKSPQRHKLMSGQDQLEQKRGMIQMTKEGYDTQMAQTKSSLGKSIYGGMV